MTWLADCCVELRRAGQTLDVCWRPRPALHAADHSRSCSWLLCQHALLGSSDQCLRSQTARQEQAPSTQLTTARRTSFTGTNRQHVQGKSSFAAIGLIHSPWLFDLQLETIIFRKPRVSAYFLEAMQPAAPASAGLAPPCISTTLAPSQSRLPEQSSCWPCLRPSTRATPAHCGSF